MNIEEILDDMDDLLDRSRPIPFVGKPRCLLCFERVLVRH